MQFFDIILFAMIAAFLVFRLRSVLGRRTGNERPRPQFPNRPDQASDADADAPDLRDNVVPLPGLNGSRKASGVGHGLAQIKIADPSFDERDFAEGAKAAFAMIVEAFAQGDTATLRPLLSDELYDEFSTAIRERLSAKETLETTLEDFRKAEIVDARMEGRTAFVTVTFVSEQSNVTRDARGDVVDGDPDDTEEIVDIWTFARNTRAQDPNWLLVKTETPEESAGDEDETDGDGASTDGEDRR